MTSLRPSVLALAVVVFAVCAFAQSPFTANDPAADRREIARLLESIEVRLGLRVTATQGEARPVNLPDIATRLEAIDNMLASSMRAATKITARNKCVNNMRQIDAAKEVWALENKKANGDNPDTKGINEYIKGGLTPTCLPEGKYEYRQIGQDPECSIHGTLSRAMPSRD